MENVPQLRPLSVGEILDKAIRIYQRQFIELIEIVALALVPTTIIQIGSIVFIGNTTIVDFFQQIIVINFISAALVSAVSSAYLQKPIEIGAAYSRGFRRFGSIIGGLFRQGLMIGGTAALIAVCAALSGGAGGILLIIWVPFAIYFYTRWGLLVPAVVIEDIGGGEGLSRSWLLTKGFFWRVFGTSILASLLAFFIAEIPGILIIFLLNMISLQPEVSQILASVTSQLTIMFTLPIVSTVTTLIYYDLRVRREGYDLELMVEAMQEKA